MTPKTTSEALEPCPFCGSPAIAENGFLPAESIVYAFCSNDECEMHNVDVGFVPETWNRRAALHPPGDQPATAGASVSIDFKQATDLLAMFGGEPTEITLMTGEGHSGPGLYAVYNADPEGSVYLGETDEEAAPEIADSAKPAGEPDDIVSLRQQLGTPHPSEALGADWETPNEGMSLLDEALIMAGVAPVDAPSKVTDEQIDAIGTQFYLTCYTPTDRKFARAVIALAAAPAPSKPEPASDGTVCPHCRCLYGWHDTKCPNLDEPASEALINLLAQSCGSANCPRGEPQPVESPGKLGDGATIRCRKCGEQTNIEFNSARIVTHNPYTGKRRDSRDIASDPEGVLMVDPSKPLKALPIEPASAPSEQRCDDCGDAVPKRSCYCREGCVHAVRATAPNEGAKSPDALLSEWKEASGRVCLTGSETEDLLQLIRAARATAPTSPALQESKAVTEPHFIEHAVTVRGRSAERWDRRATGERLYFIEGIDGSTDGKLSSVPERNTKLRDEIDAAVLALAGGKRGGE